MLNFAKKSIFINLSIIYTYVNLILWICQFFTVVSNDNNWLLHPIYTFLIIAEQYCIIAILLVLSIVEYFVFKKFNIQIKDFSNYKLFSAYFYTGIALMFLPAFILGLCIFLIPLWTKII